MKGEKIDNRIETITKLNNEIYFLMKSLNMAIDLRKKLMSEL